MITLFMYDLLQLEEKLDKFVTESNNSVNTELSGQLMKEKNQSMQRLEELVKEQKGKIDQLTEENNSSRQQIDELQVIHWPIFYFYQLFFLFWSGLTDIWIYSVPIIELTMILSGLGWWGHWNDALWLADIPNDGA